MAIIFGSARVDENGKYSGGAAGDQTGKEVSTQSYYMHSKGWYCLRPKDPAIANKIAKSMKNACDNDNIGYDQNQRTGVITSINKYGSTKAIAAKTEADCSSLVRACCIEAGFDPGNFTTYNEASKLEATGKFEKKFSVTNPDQLYNGDVLVTKTKGHTVVVVSGRARKKESNTTTTTDSLKVDDRIKVDGLVYANANGSGTCIDAKNRTLYVTEILDKKKYPYYISVSQRKGGTRFGWIAPASIKS